jgi:ketosteroid isomerase-like protein
MNMARMIRIRNYRRLFTAMCILGLVWTASRQTASGQVADAGPEARLQRVEDTLAIQQLLADYMTYMDASDYAAYSELFAADGELIFQAYRLKGPKVIRDLMEQGNRSTGTAKPGTKPGGLRHMMSNTVIRVDGDQATSTARWIVMSQGVDGRPVVGATGRYDDSLRKISGRWKFQRRVIFADFPYQNPLAPEGKP